MITDRSVSSLLPTVASGSTSQHRLTHWLNVHAEEGEGDDEDKEDGHGDDIVEDEDDVDDEDLIQQPIDSTRTLRMERMMMRLGVKRIGHDEDVEDDDGEEDEEFTRYIDTAMCKLWWGGWGWGWGRWGGWRIDGGHCQEDADVYKVNGGTS